MGKLDKILLSRALLTKTVLGAAAAAALTTGTVLGVSAYRSGNDFHPSGTERDFNANQVHFDDDQDVKGSDSSAEKDNSEFWEKDDSADDTSDPQDNNSADFMFQRERMQENFSDPISVVSSTAGTNVMNGGVTAGGSGDAVYNVTNDRSNADIIIGGRPGGNTVVVPGNGGSGTGAGTGENPGGNGSAENPSEPSTPNTPVEPSNPSTPSQPGNNNPSKPNGGNSGGSTTPSTPDTPSVTPTPGNAGLNNESVPGNGETSTDPDTDQKTDQGGMVMPNCDHSYYEGCITEPTDNMVYIGKPFDAWGGELEYVSALYRGQKNVTQKTIFNALATYVQSSYFDDRYKWDSAAAHLGEDKYICIDAVWINGIRIPFTTETPAVNIPDDVESIEIEVRYRFSTKEDWRSYPRVNYELEQSRLIILSQVLAGANQQIDNDTVLNGSSKETPGIGSTVYLHPYQYALMEKNNLLNTDDKRIYALYPGWKENGKLVSWNYEVSAGRHVLEPSARVPLDSRYIVKMVVGSVLGAPISAPYLQTLTSYTGKAVDTLEVPEYIQSVAMDKDNTLSSVKYLKLSSTVCNIDTEGTYMKVTDGYIVDDNNSWYSTVDGILTDKEQTQFLAIPYDKTELTIPEGVRQVALPTDTKITKIKIETTDPDQLPYIQYGGMTSGVIEVDDSVLDAFVNDNAYSLTGKNITVTSNSQIVKNDAIFADQEKTLSRVLTTNSVYNVPSTVTKIGENAFAYNTYIDTVILPNCDNLVLEPGCFTESSVSKLMVYSKAQKDNAEKQLQAMGVTDIAVIELSKTQEGSCYYTDDDETILLLPAPNVTSFTGVETAQDGSEVKFTTIADNAFRNNTTLQWAIMDECVKHIGANAFEGCQVLEGILIDSRDTVSIGSGAFDSCPSLYFVASNAKTAELAEWFYINVVNNSVHNQEALMKAWCPSENAGYNGSWSCFPNTDITRYGVIDLANGGKMLYAYDSDDNPWLGLRAGKTLQGDIELPTTTRELFDRCMQDIPDEFTLNWEDMTSLIAVDEYALAYSGLQGSVKMQASMVSSRAFLQTAITDAAFTNQVRYISEQAFGGCTKLTHVNISAGFEPYNSSLGSNAFGGCSSLESIEISGMNVPQLTLSGADAAFVFNGDWNNEEEASKIILAEDLSQSEYMITQLVKTWRYAMIGCSKAGDETAYQRLWNRYYYNLDASLQGEERLRAADAAVKQDVLNAENRIRRLLGVAEVDDPTEFYPYHIDDGYLTLVGAPANTEGVKLNCSSLEIPDEWCLDYVGTGAFANSRMLQSVEFDYGLAGIQQDAFKGVESGSLRLLFHDNNTIPELILEEEGKPFSFGMDEDNIHITLDPVFYEPNYEGYIEKWAYPLAGYSDYESMHDALIKEDGATEESVLEKMTEMLLDAENRLRRMMGLEEVDELSFTVGPEQNEEIEQPGQNGGTENGNENGTDGTGDSGETNGGTGGSSDGDDDMKPIPTPGTDTDSSTDNSDNIPTIDDDAANEPTDDDSDTDTGSADTSADGTIVLPMENGKYEIVIPSAPSDSASTEEKGETE